MEDNTNEKQQPGPTPGEATRRKKRKGGWGGRRPGAGAPKGNLNGFKHGRRSRQLADAVMFFAGNPATRATFMALANRYQLKQEKAEDLVTRTLVSFVTRGIRIENEEQARAIMGLIRAMAEK